MIPYIKGRQLYLRGAGYKESNHGRYQILYLQILCMKTKIIKENMLYFLSRMAGKYVKDMNEDGITT